MPIFCSNCGVSLPDGVAFCDACGTPVRGQQAQPGSQQTFVPYHGSPQGAGVVPTPGAGSVACPVCGAAAIPGEAFCDNCGASLLGGSYAASPVVQQPAPVPSYSPPPVSGYAPAAQQRSAVLVITSPPPPATLSVPERPELIVGRSDPQSNSYPDVDLGPYGGLELGISRRHFRLSRTGEQFYIEDLSSVNGTVINGQRIPAHNLHPLRPGDRIALGKMEMTFDFT